MASGGTASGPALPPAAAAAAEEEREGEATTGVDQSETPPRAGMENLDKGQALDVGAPPAVGGSEAPRAGAEAAEAAPRGGADAAEEKEGNVLMVGAIVVGGEPRRG